ncbi:YchJ family protein [Sediminihaliea albiluteola]|nr:YchJ family protein [Sediminihaliea albiluteola]
MIKTQQLVADCPCGSLKPYLDCCGRYHNGEDAPSPEALMRSRFSAFSLQLADYLRATWHPSTRPSTLDLDDSTQWLALQIFASEVAKQVGQVQFQAIYRQASQWGYLQENSEFVREGSRWYYLQGQTQQGTLKPGRNEACPCGSGRKFKACCL